MATEAAVRGEGSRTKAWLILGAVACVLALAAGLLVLFLWGTYSPFARLRPLDPRVEVSAAGEGDYALGATDQPLEVGDTVRTDPGGRCEVAYHEGSLTRLGPATTFELTELTDAPALHLRLEVGQLWQRVARLTGTEGSFRIHTPAATATLAGTVFATDCTAEGTCTFTVIDGRLHLVTSAGEELTLRAGEQVTISADGAPGETEQLTEDDLWADDWIAYNLERDGQSRGESRPEPTPEVLRAEEAPLLIAEEGDRSSIVRVNPDGSDRRLLTDDGSQAVWSPDRTRIAFLRDETGEDPVEMWVMSADGTDQRLLASVSERDAALWGVRPAWAPDGKRLAFVRERPKPADYDPSSVDIGTVGCADIWVMDLDRGDERRLVEQVVPTSVAWSPRGDEIAFVSGFTLTGAQCMDGTFGFHILETDGSFKRELDMGGTSAPGADYPIAKIDWSPNTTEFVVEEGKLDERPRVLIMNSDGSRIRPLFERCGRPPSDGERCYSSPGWSPDGRKVGYTMWRLNVDEAGNVSGTPSEVWVANPDGSDSHAVTQGFLWDW